MRALAVGLLLLLPLVAACEAKPDEQVTVTPNFAAGELTLSVLPSETAPAKALVISCEEHEAFCEEVVTNKALQPVAATTACTQIYGGPEQATLTGEVADRSISLEFARNDGCQIARWDALAQALAQAGIDELVSAGEAQA